MLFSRLMGSDFNMLLELVVGGHRDKMYPVPDMEALTRLIF